MHNSRHIFWAASLLMLAITLSVRADEATGPPQQIASGMIESIDSGRGSVTIKSFDRSLTFSVATDAAITTTNSPAATIQELKVGDVIEVQYDQLLVVHRLSQLVVDPPPPAPGDVPDEMPR
ncbi:MAG: hypothetical protein K8T26_04120 [Lentisphaerae bacterium]|nr:hypothetical protein [Lentisphaerota bacterium]